ncbi:DNA cytosine methyltransferase [Pseudomonas sp. Ga0074129]|uniref:DNA cytosine methyltransferase n=1 Tax=Pseudomonas sp. Ga0074129 TaxID=1752219 RepID=UPI000AA3E880|nr:DNA cytosine methyltransferase [Pseudomonas sp. Ga0074129]
MAAYYNEIDPYAAEWLRNLIKAGHIAPGVVDERSIEDVKPDELLGYTQCHFFAGVGVWSLALRRAGWPDNRPVWTGSCPCQPFSSAGAQAGFADERHLWPAFQWLIEQCQPTVVFGEQVASKAVDPWVDLVHADLEAMGYAFGAVPFPSSGVGAPHIRDRLFWGGHANNSGLEGHTGDGGAAGRARSYRPVATPSVLGGMGNPKLQQRQDGEPGICTEHDTGGRVEGATALAGLCSDCGLADLHSDGRDKARKRIAAPRNDGPFRDGGVATGKSTASPTNGLWADADWLFCRDGKWRAVEPSTFPLANGASSRVGRLRAYGNAINAEAAKEFIAAYMQM